MAHRAIDKRSQTLEVNNRKRC